MARKAKDIDRQKIKGMKENDIIDALKVILDQLEALEVKKDDHETRLKALEG